MRKDVARNRATLLDSADVLFRERGMSTTLDEVAKHAGVGVATAYRHFDSKQALMAELLSDRIDQAEAIMRHALALDDPREALEMFIYRTCESQARDRGLRESLGGEHGIGYTDRLRDRLGPLAAQMVQRAQAAGLLRPEITTLDIPMLFHIVGIVSDFVGTAAPEVWRRYLDIMVDGMLAEGVARHVIEEPALDEAGLQRVAFIWGNAES